MLTLSHVSKSYQGGRVHALEDITLDIRQGEFFGIIGPDGGGKTTLYRLLTNLLVPDSGTITLTVDGTDIPSRRAKDYFGYMPGRFSLYQDLTVEENLNFFASLYGISDIHAPLEPSPAPSREGRGVDATASRSPLSTGEGNQVVEGALLCEAHSVSPYDLISDIYRQIEPFRTRRAGKLSGGMKQKLALSCALIHVPRILFLDEPTTGVDPVSRRELFAMLRKLNRQYGITIVVSTPYRDEVMACSRIALLDKGHITAIGRPDEVMEPELCLTHEHVQGAGEDVIVVDGLTKQFGTFTAVDHISFRVHRGEIFGFLGANGAGKTTAMRMLCGLSQPTAGRATVAGFDCATQYEEIKRHIGYMSQKFALYEDLTVEENMRLYGGIYGMTRNQIRQQTYRMLRDLGAEEIRHAMVRSLPLGWKQKLAFSISIFHNPSIVFLDEPTGGVDAETRRQFWELIYRAASRGITVFVTTHYMDEAEYCDRVSIMVDGEIRALDSPSRLKLAYGADSMYDVFLRLARTAKRS